MNFRLLELQKKIQDECFAYAKHLIKDMLYQYLTTLELGKYISEWPDPKAAIYRALFYFDKNTNQTTYSQRALLAVNG